MSTEHDIIIEAHMPSINTPSMCVFTLLHTQSEFVEHPARLKPVRNELHFDSGGGAVNRARKKSTKVRRERIK